MFCNAVEIVFLCLSLIPYNEFYVRQLTKKKKCFFRLICRNKGDYCDKMNFLSITADVNSCAMFSSLKISFCSVRQEEAEVDFRIIMSINSVLR